MELRYDAAGEDSSQDRFRFDQVAKQIAESVLGVLKRDEIPSAFVVGLEGRWGSGKSTIINYVKARLAGRHDNRVHLITFDPWWLNDETNIQSGLLASISTGLPAKGSKRSLELLGKLTKAASAVPPSISGLLKLSSKTEGLAGLIDAARSAGGDASRLLTATKSPRQLREELAKELRAHCLRFVVIIDDLDRLGPDKAVNVLSALRQVGDLPGFVDIIAYDPEAIENILGSFSPPLSGDFLEKVVNISISVPPVSGGQMVDFLSSTMTPNAYDSLKASTAHSDALVRLLDTPREAVRLGNSINFWSESKLREVYPPDFILLEAVRLKSARAYHGLLRTSDIWLNHPSSVFSSLSSPSDEEKETISRRVDRELGLGKSDFDSKIRSAIGVLFPKSADYFRTKSFGSSDAHARAIREPEDFFMYFFHLPLPGAPSDSDVSALVSSTTDLAIKSGIVERFASAVSGDVRPFDVLASQVERRLERATEEAKLSVVQAVLEAGAAISASPRSSDSLGGNFETARYTVSRILRSLGKLDDNQVRILINSSRDVSMLASLQLTISAGTSFYLLEDRDSEPVISVSKAAQESLRQFTLDKISDAIDDKSIINSPMMPRLIYMAQKAGRLDIVEKFRAQSSDPTWLLDVVAAYRGYANARTAAMELLGLSDVEFSNRLEAAAMSGIRPDLQEYALSVARKRSDDW